MLFHISSKFDLLIGVEMVMCHPFIVLINGCFHDGQAICPRLSHNGPRKVVLARGVKIGHMDRLNVQG